MRQVKEVFADLQHIIQPMESLAFGRREPYPVTREIETIWKQCGRDIEGLINKYPPGGGTADDRAAETPGGWFYRDCYLIFSRIASSANTAAFSCDWDVVRKLTATLQRIAVWQESAEKIVMAAGVKAKELGDADV